LRDRFVFRRHRFDIENDFEGGRLKLIHKTNRFLGGIDEIRFGRSQRFQTDGHAGIKSATDRRGKGLARPFPGLIVADVLHDISLLRRTNDDDTASKIGAELD
jgi:hypothetical protein